MNKLKFTLFCFSIIILIQFKAQGAPSVLIGVSGNIYEDGLFSGDVIQTDPVSLFSPDLQYSGQLVPVQPSSSGVFTGQTSVSVSAQNGTIHVQRSSSLTFTHSSGGDVIGDTIGSSLSLSFYVLGGPGTPFSWVANDTASGAISYDTADYAPYIDYNDIGYSNPGFAYNWGLAGGEASGNGTSTNATITYAGQTYSEINLTPSLSEDAGFAYSGGYFSPPVVNGNLQGDFSMTVQDLAAPVPEPRVILLVFVFFTLLRKTKRAVTQSL